MLRLMDLGSDSMAYETEMEKCDKTLTFSSKNKMKANSYINPRRAGGVFEHPPPQVFRR